MKRIRRPQWLTTANLIVACAILALVAVLGTLYASQQSNISTRDDRIAAQHSRIDELAQQNSYLTEQYTKVYGQAKKEGVEPTTAPPSTLPKAGAPGAPGSSGSSGKDGRGVAFALCTALGWQVTYSDGETDNAGRCVGTTGKPGSIGKAGKDGSDGSNGAVGAAGADSTVPGPVGASGADSSVPGPQGPAGPTGASGADGAPGSAGTDGRGIASVSCVDGPAFRFTYTDGTTTDIPGSCNAPAPAPTTDPTPAG